MKTPLVSISLCTYNGKNFIREQIDSILQQSVKPDEIVIVDDCSTDGTLQILEIYAGEHENIKLYPLAENVGAIQAFKKAISLTNHPYIFLADQDDIWNPHKIEKMLSRAASFSQTLPLVIYSDLEMINEEGKTIYPSFWEMSDLSPARANFKNLMFSNVVTGSACMINDKMKEEIKLTPEGVLMHDHWIALIAYGFGQYVYTEEKLVKYRAHQNSVTKKVPVNIIWRIKNQLFQWFKPQKNFLDMEITQMEQYSELYQSHLSSSDQQALCKFLALKQKTFLEKKFYSFTRKIIPSS